VKVGRLNLLAAWSVALGGPKAQERRDGGIFQANPVTMTVKQLHGKWVITAYDEQEAEEAR
jgi:hypothetical protein